MEILQMDLWGILFILTMITAMGMVLFAKEVTIVIVGVMIIAMNASILDDNNQNVQEKAFVLQQFQAGEAIECSLWRGSATRVDPAHGWKLIDNNRFIKDDQIINDADLCHVIGKVAPLSSSAGGWIFIIVMTLGTLLGRIGIRAWNSHD